MSLRNILIEPQKRLDCNGKAVMIRLSESMSDALAATDSIEGMSAEVSRWPLSVLRQVRELDTVVDGYRVDAVRNGLDERFKEGSRSSYVGAFHQFDNDQIDMEVADGIAVELLPFGLDSFHPGQAADAMRLKATMQRRAGQFGDRGLQRIQTVIQRQ